MTDLVVEELPGEDGSVVVWVQAGAHGDELDGVVALELFRDAARAEPPPVTVRLARPANPVAFREQARCASTDGLDLNRCFPGDPDGSPSQRLAARLWDAMRGCHAVVDVHSSSPTLVGYPHVIVQDGGQPQHAAALAAARASGVPIVWRSAGSWLAGSLLHAAGSEGRPVCLLDIGASRPWHGAPSLRPALTRVLATFAASAGPTGPGPLPEPGPGQVEIGDPQWLAAPVGGVLLELAEPGAVVGPGAAVGVVRGADGRSTPVVWPGPEPGLVVTVRARRDVTAQTPVVSVAGLPEQFRTRRVERMRG
jgi:predicted deacylase